MFIDTHAHLYSDEFESDIEQVIANAEDANIRQILLPNIDLASIDGMLALEKRFPNVFKSMMGLHPCSVDANWEEILQEMHKHFDHHPFVAVGEIGIDLYWDQSFINEQKEAFRTQINWAKEKQLPIVIHARDSFPEIYEVLDQEYDERLKGVFHCFTGNPDDVTKILSYSDFYFGIGGVVTYKKSDLPSILPLIPTEKLILETDAPYLPPTPHRGKRNESAYLVYTAEKVAESLELSLDEVAKFTTENAQKLFGLT